MNLFLNPGLAENYKSPSQIARVLTESWVREQIFCPNCGSGVEEFENNRPVADFYCKHCSEEYELKSKRDVMGRKIVDGEYEKMIGRLNSENNPNFFFLNYSLADYSVINFLVIPKHFFIPDIIEKRKPLAISAERFGWVGCNILLQSIPESGKIFYVKESIPQKRKNVLENWKKTLFLREADRAEVKGWILDIMKCIDGLRKREFTLNELYGYEGFLSKKYPKNKHIKDKIRQQLQFLRDKGYLEFVDRGKYRIKQ